MKFSFNVVATLVALAAVLLGGCQTTGGGSGPMPAPVFIQLHVPQSGSSNGWATLPLGPGPFAVLPTRGLGVRIDFSAPIGSTFGVSLRALDGTLTPLIENRSGTPPLPSPAGHFEITAVNPTANPIYSMYVRAPATLADPANFDILVTNLSLQSGRTDSAPMVVMLRARPVTTVTVTVVGDGRVTSSPSGITCGKRDSGAPLTDCTFNFNIGSVRLAAQSVNTSNHFIRWTGNCIPSGQYCDLNVDGTAALAVTAEFGAAGTALPPVCSTMPAIPGLRWIGLPGCSDPGYNPGISLACDAQGYFCCAPDSNANDTRCGGQGKKLIAADCRHLGIKAMPRQPGGCYEIY